MTTLKHRLIAERERKVWSQTDLANAAKISQSFIGALESKGQENSKYLPEIAHALGVDAYWLKTGKGVRSPGRQLNADEELILEAFQTFVPEVKEIWLDTARKEVSRQRETKNKAA